MTGGEKAYQNRISDSNEAPLRPEDNQGHPTLNPIVGATLVVARLFLFARPAPPMGRPQGTPLR